MALHLLHEWEAFKLAPMRLKQVLFLFIPIIILCTPLLTPYASADVPTINDYITDEVGVLANSQRFQVTYDICALVEQETSAVLAILVVNSTGGQDIAMFATEAFNENGIGQEDKDNGVLIVVAVGDRTYFVAVGRGLEGLLNDAKIGRFARDYFVPYAEYDQWSEGLYSLTVVLADEIVNNYEQAEPHSYPIEWIPLELPQLLLAVAITGFIIVITKGHVFVWAGGLFGSLGKGRSGGGGAGGKV